MYDMTSGTAEHSFLPFAVLVLPTLSHRSSSRCDGHHTLRSLLDGSGCGSLSWLQVLAKGRFNDLGNRRLSIYGFVMDLLVERLWQADGHDRPLVGVLLWTTSGSHVISFGMERQDQRKGDRVERAGFIARFLICARYLLGPPMSEFVDRKSGASSHPLATLIPRPQTEVLITGGSRGPQSSDGQESS